MPSPSLGLATALPSPPWNTWRHWHSLLARGTGGIYSAKARGSRRVALGKGSAQRCPELYVTNIYIIYIYIEFNSWLIAVAVWPYARCKKSMEIRSLLNFNAHIRTLSSCICMNVDEEGWWWMAEWPFPCFETQQCHLQDRLTWFFWASWKTAPSNSCRTSGKTAYRSGNQLKTQQSDPGSFLHLCISLPSSLFKSITHFGIKLRDVVLYTNPPWSNN